MNHVTSTALVALSLCWVAQGAAWAQAWPSRPIKMIIPFAPGGGTDVVGRVVAKYLSAQLGQQVVVENRAGANGIVGIQALLQAAPDGYTVAGVGDGTLVMNPALYDKLPYDTLRDLALVARTVRFPGMIAVHPSVPARSIPALIALAKAKPDALAYASGGLGNASHLAMELFAVSTGTRLLHVPHNGTGPAAVALLAGHVQVIFNNVQTTLPYVKEGKLVALGIGEARRMESLPNIPAIAEFVPGYEMTPWTGVVAPAATPAAIVARLSAEITAIMRHPEVTALFENQQLVPSPLSTNEFRQFIGQELVKWDKVIKSAGIKLN